MSQTACTVSPPTGLAWAHPLVQEWFVNKFGTPTEPQEQGWPHILGDKTTLICAPTGSGKTLAAFLACIDRLVRKALAHHPEEKIISLLAISVSQLEKLIDLQLELPLAPDDDKRRPGSKRGVARWLADHAVAERSHLDGRDLGRGQVEELEVGWLRAEGACDHAHRVGALELEAVMLAPPVIAQR